MLKNRSTGEVLILLVGMTICGYVVVSGTVVLVLSFVNPDASFLTTAARNIADIINTLIGLLAGFLAGKTDSLVLKKELEKTQEELHKEPPT
jgi:hypothetical protein